VTTTPLGSVSLNGTSQYLSTASNAAFGYGSGDFTVEMWYYFTGTTSDTRYFFDQRTSAGGTQLAPAVLLVSGVINVYLNGVYAIVGPTVTTNTWNHLALVRSSGVTKLYINGSQAGSNYTDANSYVASQMSIGYTSSAVNTYNWIGYISNFRVVKGVAVYTGNFVPPTTVLPATQSSGSNISAITGTQTSLLLTTPNNAAFITDSSTNAFTVTNNGAATAAALTPFNFSPLGSVSFNGSSQYLSVANNAALQFGGDFTVEMWLYPTALSGAKGVLGQRASEANSSPVLIELSSAAVTFYVSTSGSSVTLTSPNITVNTWTHVALVRSGTTVSYYINGFAGGTTGTLVGALMTPVASTYIGIDSASPTGVGYFPGYISNFRIVKGVAVYTGPFTPPTGPLAISQNAGTNIAAVAGTQTSLLLQTPNNANFITDSSVNNFTVTNVGTATASALTPFNTFQATAGGWVVTS
jgi:hypothetical protein